MTDITKFVEAKTKAAHTGLIMIRHQHLALMAAIECVGKDGMPNPFALEHLDNYRTAVEKAQEDYLDKALFVLEEII